MREIENMAECIELIKSAVRLFLIVWGAILYGVCVIKGISVPEPVSALVAAIVVEYFGERAIVRLKGSAGDGGVK